MNDNPLRVAPPYEAPGEVEPQEYDYTNAILMAVVCDYHKTGKMSQVSKDLHEFIAERIADDPAEVMKLLGVYDSSAEHSLACDGVLIEYIKQFIEGDEKWYVDHYGLDIESTEWAV